MSEKSLAEQRQQRIRNLEALEEAGFDGHPYTYSVTHTASELQEKYAGGEPGDEWDEEVVVAGRAMTIRSMGKVTFATLADSSRSEERRVGEERGDRWWAA